VKSVDPLCTRKKGLGASRICHFYDGTNVKEAATTFNDSKVLEVSDLIPEIAAKALDSNKTEISFGEVWPNRALTWCDLAEGEDEISITKTMLAAINERVETGELVQKRDTFPSSEVPALVWNNTDH
jgi:hypothetical protein